jgi:hypothetical protein
VKPPPEFKAGNPPALSGKQDLDLGPSGPNQMEAATDDAQVLLTFTKAAVPPHPGDTGLTVAIQPLDPKTLSPPPSTVRVDGNAYKLLMTYRPSGDPVPGLTQPGNMFLSYPTSADRIVFSPDGKAWQQIKATRVGNNLQLGGDFTKPGYYEAAGPPNAGTQKKSGGGATRGVLIMGGIAVLVFSPLAILFLRRRPATGGKKPKGKAGRNRR